MLNLRAAGRGERPQRWRTALRLAVLLALIVTGVQLLNIERQRPALDGGDQRPAALPAGDRARPPVASPATETASPAAADAAPPSLPPAPPPDPVLAAVPPPGHQPAATDQLVTAPGAGAVAGSGPLRRYLVEVETGTGVDVALFAQAVETVLSNPHSWIGAGDLAVQRVDSEPVDFRVTLAHPDTVDRHCAELGTDGRYSCWNGARAMLNLTNWVAGIPDYSADVGGYRRYLVNHEVGHALGHDHESCPGPGTPAPVMMQQTKGVAPCLPNSWPYP